MDSIPGSGRCPGVGNIFLPRKFYVQRSLASYSPQDCKRVKHNWGTKQQQWQHGIVWPWVLSSGPVFPVEPQRAQEGSELLARLSCVPFRKTAEHADWETVLYLTTPEMVKFLYVVLKFLYSDKRGSPSLVHIWKWQLTPVFLPGKSQGQRRWAGYGPWGHKESDTTEWLNHHHTYMSFLVAQTVKNLHAVQETQVRFLDWEDPLEKGMATHSSILAWRIPWMEEPGGLQSMGSQRVGHNWATYTYISKLSFPIFSIGREGFQRHMLCCLSWKMLLFISW